MAARPENIEAAALREIRAELLGLKDDILSRIARGSEISSVEVLRLQNFLRDLQREDLGGIMGEVLSRHSQWSYEQGIEMIDGIVAGEGLSRVLGVPDEVLAPLPSYGADLIRTIPGVLLDDVTKKITLSYTGQRTPSEVAAAIAREFDVSIRRAETIVRTEVHTLQNAGSETRIQSVAARAKAREIPMERMWVHSSGSVEGYRRGKFRARYEPRQHHKAMHGKTVPPDKLFTLTNPITGESWEITGPHDEPLPAGEVVNCYCSRAIKFDRDKIKLRNAA